MLAHIQLGPRPILNLPPHPFSSHPVSRASALALVPALAIALQILSNFGNDVLEALSGTCTQWLAGKKRLWQLGSDALVAGVIVTLHALTLMCQVGGLVGSQAGRGNRGGG